MKDTFNISKVITEWAYRLTNGTPSMGNRYDLLVLRQILTEQGYPPEFVKEYMDNIQEDDIVKNKKSGNQYVVQNHNAQTQTLVTKDASPEEIEKAEDGDKKEPSSVKTKSKFSEEEIQERLAIDRNSVESSLHMTKEQADAQSLQKGKKDVGLGTATSRAGEAMVHKGVQLLKEGKSLEEIEASFNEIVNTPGHILNNKTGKKWVGACIGSLKRIDSEIGIDNIQNVAWDTDQGREAIGVDPKVNTSSDMFIQKNDGTNVGISLKKDGAVFLISGGWEKQANTILDNLKDNMSPEAHAELSEAMSMGAYVKDLGQRIERTLDAVGPEEMAQSVEKLKAELAVRGENQFFKGSSLPKYLAVLENPAELHSKILLGPKTKDNPNGASSLEMKAFIKIVQYNHPEQNADIRGVDHALNKRMYDAMNKSPEAKSGMKQFVIRSMHLREALDINPTTKEGGVDNFMTVYGIPPDGAVLNEKTIVDLFGPEFGNTLAKVKSGEADASELDQIIEDKIEFDFENRRIVFKHENNKRYPLFTMGGRAKGLGGSPAMEIAQTPLMAYALKAGTFDSTKWPPKMQEKFKKQIGEME